MKMLIDILPPIPPGVNQSYLPFGWAKYGVCAWVYDGYRGETEWINFQHFVTEPKYQNVTAFDYWFQHGVTAIIKAKLEVNSKVPDISINGVNYNMATGKNMPLLLNTGL
jgi:hypothetical protein